MEKALPRLSKEDRERVTDILEIVKKENSAIQKALVNMLPAYIDLLAIHAQSFEEIALLPIARQQGLPYMDWGFDFTKVKPPCPYCNEKNHIRRTKENTYQCRSCGKKYTLNQKSITAHTKLSALTWMQVLHCVTELYTMNNAALYCGIHGMTYMRVRNCIFYAIQHLMRRVKLYGEIQADNTFVRVNFKGTDLSIDDYPDDSPFAVERFIPRTARKRGGTYSHKDQNMNSVCIFAAIDDRGHVMVRYIGIGVSSSTIFEQAMSEEKFLTTVPEEDPFPLFRKKSVPDTVTQPGTPSLFISDRENILGKYARKIGLQSESHVYRRNGKQRKLGKDAHNIQRVNSLHSRIQNFLRNAHYISTKYLPGYLALFEFIENTGKSPEAVQSLFEILVEPYLAVSDDYYENMFSTPNYMIEWMSEKNVLRKYPEKHLRAAYLYGQYLKQKKENGGALMVKDIMEETGYSAATIRRHYNNFKVNGLLDEINEYYQRDAMWKAQKSQQTFDPKYLAIYQEYCDFRENGLAGIDRIEDFITYINEKYNLTFRWSNFHDHMNRIQKSGVLPPYPETTYRNRQASKASEEKAIGYVKEFQQIWDAQRAQGVQRPKSKDIYASMAEKYGCSILTMEDNVNKGRRILKARVKSGKQE